MAGSKNKWIALILVIALVGVGFFGYKFIRRRQYEYISVNNVQRQYRIYIPSSYTGNEEVPLLLGLHGAGGSAKQYQRSTGFDTIAEDNGFIMVYPDGLGTMEFSLHYWHSGHVIPRGEPEDVLFLKMLVEELLTDYEINASRVYMTGHSNGGMMTYRMAAEHANLFAAIAPVSGSIGGKPSSDESEIIIPDPSEAVSVVQFHGYLDTHVLYEGGETIDGINKGRTDRSVQNATDFWVENNNCNPTPEPIVQSTNEKINFTKYVGGDNNTEVVLLTMLEAAHSWDSINGEIVAEQFQGTKLADAIWNLLSVYHKP